MKRATQIKVIVFTVVMLLVAAGLIITFGEFRFGSGKRYHAMFSTASDLRSGQKVRIAGVPVGRVKNVSLNRDNSVEVTFDVDSKYQLYSSSRAIIRYENLVGDRYLEITAGPGELHKLPDGGTLDKEHTQPALDLDALLGGLRPVLKGFDAAKVNEISNAFIQILQGQGGTLSQLLGDTSSFTSGLAERDQLIGDVINHLNEVLATVDSKSTQFSSSVDQLQQLISGLAQQRDVVAGALPPLASTASSLESVLKDTRPYIKGTIEQARQLATRVDERKADVNVVVENLAENYLRLNALGAYGSFSTSITAPSGSRSTGP